MMLTRALLSNRDVSAAALAMSFHGTSVWSQRFVGATFLIPSLIVADKGHDELHQVECSALSKAKGFMLDLRRIPTVRLFVE